MSTEEMNKSAMIRTTKEVVRKAKLAAAYRGNGETIGIVLGSLLDKELKRLGLGGNNEDE